MRTLAGTAIFTCLVTCVGAAHAQTGPNDSYRIQLTVQGTRIEGSQERAARLVGKTQTERDAILSEPLPTLTRGSTFQLLVAITDPSGVTSNYTGSPLLRYEHFSCLATTPSGVVTVVAQRTCNGPDKPGLWIALLSERGTPIAYNEYIFNVP